MVNSSLAISLAGAESAPNPPPHILTIDRVKQLLQAWAPQPEAAHHHHHGSNFGRPPPAAAASAGHHRISNALCPSANKSLEHRHGAGATDSRTVSSRISDHAGSPRSLPCQLVGAGRHHDRHDGGSERLGQPEGSLDVARSPGRPSDRDPGSATTTSRQTQSGMVGQQAVPVTGTISLPAMKPVGSPPHASLGHQDGAGRVGSEAVKGPEPTWSLRPSQRLALPHLAAARRCLKQAPDSAAEMTPVMQLPLRHDPNPTSGLDVTVVRASARAALAQAGTGEGRAGSGRTASEDCMVMKLLSCQHSSQGVRGRKVGRLASLLAPRTASMPDSTADPAFQPVAVVAGSVSESSAQRFEQRPVPMTASEYLQASVQYGIMSGGGAGNGIGGMASQELCILSSVNQPAESPLHCLSGRPPSGRAETRDMTPRGTKRTADFMCGIDLDLHL